MRWVNYALLLIVTVVAEISIGRLLGVGGKWMPDLLLMVAVVVAFKAPLEQAPLACLVAGLVRDVSSSAVLGSYAFSFGLIALLLVSLRDMLYGEHPVLLMLLTVLFGAMAEHCVWLMEMMRHETALSDYSRIMAPAAIRLILTAVLMPYGYWLLMKLHRLLGLPTRRIYSNH